MGIGMIIGGIEAIAGIVTCNPVLIAEGARRAATSYAVGEVLEPVKEFVGDGISDLIDAIN